MCILLICGVWFIGMGALKVGYDSVPDITLLVLFIKHRDSRCSWTIISTYETVRQSWLSGLSVLEDSMSALGNYYYHYQVYYSFSISFHFSVAVWLGVGK